MKWTLFVLYSLLAIVLSVCGNLLLDISQDLCLMRRTVGTACVAWMYLAGLAAIKSLLK